jgi:hypothetical protein
MKTLAAWIVCLALLCTVCRAASTTQPRSEKEKIEALIGIVHDMKDAKFVRNGSEYDGPDAADHMRTKWSAGGSSIKTARDFIKLAASSSSVSGKPYLIRFKNGKEQTSADFLLGQLDRLEGRVPATTAPTTSPSPPR